MNERLQAKIDEIKKTLKPEEFHSLLCFDANPPKFEYEMPKAYQTGTARLLEFIEERDSFVKDLPDILPSEMAEARELISRMNQAIDDLETELDKFYREHLEKEHFEQEVWEATTLQDFISEEHYIRVKHLKPHIFERFKKCVYKGMTEAEIVEQEAIISERETKELDEILAADTTEPVFKNPHIKRISPFDLFSNTMLEFSYVVYETDDYFKETYEIIKTGRENRIDFAHKIFRALPVYRRRLDENIRQLEPSIRHTTNLLQKYFREKRADGTFTEKPDVADETIEKLLDQMERYRIEIYIAYKHLQPEKFPAYHDLVMEDSTPEEAEEFLKKVAEIEAEKLQVILKAVQNEIH